jgi:hypothetical protein
MRFQPLAFQQRCHCATTLMFAYGVYLGGI